MKRIVIWTLALVMGTLYAQAQGAGLSQGEAVKTPSYTPQTKRKTCSQCGITMGNVTYPWQHESWCPHYREQGGGGSARKSSGSSSTAYTAASAATSALGSLLSGMISSRSKSISPSPVRQKQEAEQKKLKESVKSGRHMFIQSMLTDEKYWEVGDYAVVEGKYKYEGRQAYGIINKKTGNYVLDPNKKEYKEGDYGIHRRLHLGKKIVDVEDKHFLLAQIRLLPPPEGDPSGKPFVFADYMKEYREKYKNWETVSCHWFLITDDEKLEPLDRNGTYAYNLVKRRGKVGAYYLMNYDHPYYDSISQKPDYTREVRSTDLYCKVRIPIQYDSIVSIGDASRAYIGKEFDLYLHDKYLSDNTPYTKANDAMKLFDTLEKRVVGNNTMYIASINGRYGLVNSKGEIVLPLVYGKGTNFMDYYMTISYTLWYKQEAAKYIDKKGEYEKTDHFEARMKDAKLQEDYLREIMDDAPQRYLAEKTKGGVKLTIGKYDADNEAFPISIGVAPWNIFLLPVPIAEAEAFKASFDDIKEEAVKTAQLGIRYDAPSIEAITFTTSDGKSYKYGE